MEEAEFTISKLVDECTISNQASYKDSKIYLIRNNKYVVEFKLQNDPMNPINILEIKKSTWAILPVNLIHQVITLCLIRKFNSLEIESDENTGINTLQEK